MALSTFDEIGAVRDADIAASLLRELGATGRAGPKGLERLTKREREILALLGQGLTNAEIAARLFISTKTAAHHVSNVLAKLGVRNRSEAAAYAHRFLADPTRNRQSSRSFPGPAPASWSQRDHEEVAPWERSSRCRTGGSTCPTWSCRRARASRPERIYATLADLSTHTTWAGSMHGKKNFGLRTLEASADPAVVGTEFHSTGDDPMGSFTDRSVVTEATSPSVFEFVTEGHLEPKKTRARRPATRASPTASRSLRRAREAR